MLIVAFFFLTASGAIAAYQFIYLSPQRVIARMLAQSREIDSFEFSGDASFSINTGNLAQDIISALVSSTTKITFQGKTDFSDLDNPKFEGKGAVSIAGETLISAELKTINDKMYIKIPEISQFTDDPRYTSLENQWILFDTKQLTEAYPELARNQSLNNYFQELLLKNFIYTDIKKLGSEEIDGQNMYHYSFAVDKEKMIKLYEDFQNEFPDNTSTTTLSEFQLKQLESFDFSTRSEIWIGKKDNLTHKAKISVQSTSEPKSTFTLNLYFNNFNQFMDIKKPQFFKSLDEILNSLVPSNGIRINDLSTIQSGLELYNFDCNKYPNNTPINTIRSPLIGDNSSDSCKTYNTYLQVVPNDLDHPNRKYIYALLSPNTYELCASLENGTETVTCGGSSDCGETCNYKVTNP